MIGTTISHYRILEKLGEGGMGVVYKAQDTRLDRVVAVKFISSHLSAHEENKARFTQEAKSTAALNHPNILSIYDFGELDGKMFFVMEFVEGKTLKSHLAHLKGQGIAAPQAIEWITQVAQGLRAAHEKQIVHRDMKSENIMVGSNGQLKIMDFGIAKLKGSGSLTKTGHSVGTLSYTSPEQMQGIPADERSDIWSLGVVFYEMLTGEVPFRAEHEAALSYLILNQQPPAPSMMDRRIPQAVDSVVAKMLEKDRSLRYQSAAELLEAVQHLRKDLEAMTQATKGKAVAVLPFENISSDKENDYFSDGLTEELIANLSRIKDVRVVPRTASIQYKGVKKDIRTIGRELGARYMLAGSVRKHQDNLRITVELIDAEDSNQLWAETYKGTLADVFDIQEQVSKQIVDALMLKLSPSEKIGLTKRATLNPQAFDCYLRARNFLYHYTQKSVHFAIQLFQQAIELDPRYAAAFAGLGESYSTIYQNFERKESWLDKAMEASLKAIMYDSTLSEAYASLGLAYLHRKSFDEAISSGQKAIELDPNNHIAYWILGRTKHMLDQDGEAVNLFKKVLQLDSDFYAAYGDLQIAYEKLGEKARYDEIHQAALSMYPGYLARHPDDARAHIFFAIDLVKAGRVEEARVKAGRALELSPNDPLMLYNAACFYGRLGDKKQALESLRNALLSGYAAFEWIKRDTDLESIRNEPVYIELMKDK